MNKETLVRYAVSTLISFLTGFLSSLALFFGSAEGWGDLSLKAVLMASIFAGVRLAVKYLAELLPKVKV